MVIYYFVIKLNGIHKSLLMDTIYEKSFIWIDNKQPNYLKSEKISFTGVLSMNCFSKLYIYETT